MTAPKKPPAKEEDYGPAFYEGVRYHWRCPKCDEITEDTEDVQDGAELECDACGWTGELERGV